MILYTGTLSGGTERTRNLCVHEKKPFIAINAAETPVAEAALAVLQLIADDQCKVINVAGPRASGWPHGHAFAQAVVGAVIAGLRQNDAT